MSAAAANAGPLGADPLSATFAALADPTRRAILAQLADGEASVGDLSEPFSISAPAISRHLRVLEGAGLISRQPKGQQRICRIEPQALKRASEWVEQYRRFWEQRFDALERYLDETASAKKPSKKTGASKKKDDRNG